MKINIENVNINVTSKSIIVIAMSSTIVLFVIHLLGK